MNGWDNESKIYFSKTNATFHILDNFEDFKKNGGVDTPYEIWIWRPAFFFFQIPRPIAVQA